MSTFIKALQDKMNSLENKKNNLLRENNVLALSIQKNSLLVENTRLRKMINEAARQPPSAYDPPSDLLRPMYDRVTTLGDFNTQVISPIGDAIGGGVNAIGGALGSLVSGIQNLLELIARRTEPTGGTADPNTGAYNILRPALQQLNDILNEEGANLDQQTLYTIHQAIIDIEQAMQSGTMNSGNMDSILNLLARLSDSQTWVLPNGAVQITPEELNMFQQAYYYLLKFLTQRGPIADYDTPSQGNPDFPLDPRGPGPGSSSGGFPVGGGGANPGLGPTWRGGY